MYRNKQLVIMIGMSILLSGLLMLSGCSNCTLEKGCYKCNPSGIYDRVMLLGISDYVSGAYLSWNKSPYPEINNEWLRRFNKHVSKEFGITFVSTVRSIGMVSTNTLLPFLQSEGLATLLSPIEYVPRDELETFVPFMQSISREVSVGMIGFCVEADGTEYTERM